MRKFVIGTLVIQITLFWVKLIRQPWSFIVLSIGKNSCWWIKWLYLIPMQKQLEMVRIWQHIFELLGSPISTINTTDTLQGRPRFSQSLDSRNGWKWWAEGSAGAGDHTNHIHVIKRLVWVTHGYGNTSLGSLGQQYPPALPTPLQDRSRFQPKLGQHKQLKMVSWGGYRTIYTISILQNT